MAESVTSMPGGVVLEHYTPPGISTWRFSDGVHLQSPRLNLSNVAA